MVKKILICGAAGFIGTNLVDFFSKNPQFEVHGVFNKKQPVYRDQFISHHCDLTNPAATEALIATVKPNYIFQAAATTSGINDIVNTPAIHITDNAVMNSYLFKFAAEQNVEHLIFFSCTVMYRSSLKPVRENDFDANETLHNNYFGAGHTKLYLEKMCEFYSRIGRTKFTAIRHSNIYGPHDKFDALKSHFFGASVAKVMNAKSHVQVWGSGKEKRDLLYIDDLMAMVQAVIERQREPYRLFNCGLGRAYSVEKVVRLLIKASGKSLQLSFDKTRPSIDFNLSLNCDRALQELGWRPAIMLEDGIEKTLDWYLKNQQHETKIKLS